ncbi:DUF6214 family protein [Streptomyces sp. NBC_00124]|uniref:DUF6214 family protein n=1 Tax=Streptomyces sp. NBC_00124 TaxID=2975662 RepID=UPI0022584E26|nr:DUF6214 family protein [Streptomyces sp. NBC_00124]MCX5365597.1 DUF6214 family protein [Streptomyces sp. NBC_00124]
MSVWPAWAVQEGGSATAWFNVRLAFTDGARVDALAVVAEGQVSIEDVRAQPALSLDDLAVFADWIEGPLFEACGAGPAEGDDEPTGSRRARPAWPRGVEGRWLLAQEYRAAQEDGVDPVLAVMCATGHSRRKSLRMIAQARDAGYLTPRHARR